ncbi:MAG: GAF domain-containing protein [Halobacteriota archaeon]
MDNSETLNILLIEDNPADSEFIEDLLEDAEPSYFSIDVAERLSDGMVQCTEKLYDAILLDLALPDSTGAETFETLSRSAADVPIIILTGLEDRALALELVRSGAQDYLVKGQFDYDRIERSIRYAIERMQAHETLERELAINAALARLTAPLLSPSSDPEGLSLAILDEAKQLTGSKHGFMEWIDRETKDMISYGHTQMMLDECAIPYEKRQIRFPIGADGKYHALSTHAINTKKGFFTNAPTEHSASTGALEGHVRIDQFLAVPALLGGEAVGEIALANPGRDYTQRDVAAVERLAEVYALTIMRMWAEEDTQQHAHRAAALNDIIHFINKTSDLSTLYDRALPLIAKRLGFDGGHICVRDNSRDVTGLKASYHVPRAYADAFRSISIDASPYLSRLYRRGQSEFIEDYSRAVPERGTLSGMKSVAAVPFTSEGTVVGHIGLATVTVHHFTQEERELLTTIGRELGTAVAKLKAKAGAEEHARRQDILTRIITAGNKASDLSVACAAMLDTALDMLPLFYGCIFLLDQQNADAVILQSSHGYTEEQLEWAQRIPITQRLTAQVMAGIPLFYDDYQAVASPDAQSMNSEVQSMTLIPLVAGDTVLGFYNLGSHGEQHHFSDDEQKLLITVGEEAGTIVARLQAEESIKEQAELLNLANDAIIVRTLDHYVTFWNNGAKVLFGWTQDEALGKHAPTLLQTVSTTSPEAAQQELLNTGRWRCEVEVTTKEGEKRYVEQSWTLKRDDDGTPVAIFNILHNVTEHRNAELELQRYSDHLEDLVEKRTGQLKDAERLAAIGQTATMIGHDLRNPLQALQLLVDLAGTYYNDIPPELKERFDAATAERIFSSVEQQIKYMDKIVSDLQDYSRPLALEFEEVHLAAFVSDTLALLMIPESVSVNVSGADSITARVDSHLMQRALSNLIMNAVQAMPHGGTLTLSAALEDGSVAIRVTDTGLGIPADMRDKVFSPLATGKAKGTGLGLAVVKRIVKAHNGTITFESEEGKGTTFTVTLPQTVQ